MPDVIPLKLLFQHQDQSDMSKWRLTALVDADTLRQMLAKLEADPSNPVAICAEMPSEHMEVHVEIYQKGSPLSGLIYSKHLNEHGWITNHVTLVRS